MLLQVSRLKRELERVTEERDKAREEGKKADQARVQVGPCNACNHAAF